MFNKHPEIEHWFCAGDVIDMFGKSWNNIPTLRKMLKKKVVSIFGNHEAEILGSKLKIREYEKEPEILNYLTNMSFSLTIYFFGLIIDVFHSTPQGVNDYMHPDAPLQDYLDKFNVLTSDIVIVGHTHKLYKKEFKSYKIVNPGALGMEDAT